MSGSLPPCGAFSGCCYSYCYWCHCFQCCCCCGYAAAATSARVPESGARLVSSCFELRTKPSVAMCRSSGLNEAGQLPCACFKNCGRALMLGDDWPHLSTRRRSPLKIDPGCHALFCSTDSVSPSPPKKPLSPLNACLPRDLFFALHLHVADKSCASPLCTECRLFHCCTERLFAIVVGWKCSAITYGWVVRLRGAPLPLPMLIGARQVHTKQNNPTGTCPWTLPTGRIMGLPCGGWLMGAREVRNGRPFPMGAPFSFRDTDDATQSCRCVGSQALIRQACVLPCLDTFGRPMMIFLTGFCMPGQCKAPPRAGRAPGACATIPLGSSPCCRIHGRCSHRTAYTAVLLGLDFRRGRSARLFVPMHCALLFVSGALRNKKHVESRERYGQLLTWCFLSGGLCVA